MLITANLCLLALEYEAAIHDFIFAKIAYRAATGTRGTRGANLSA
ncbi:MAG: hypothetical protein ACLPIX_12820 [Rhodomicrobium sp.]